MQTLNTLTLLRHAILERRKKLKLSQATVAARLGISQNRYSELEKSVAKIDADRLLRLLSILGLALHIGLKAEPSPANNDPESW